MWKSINLQNSEYSTTGGKPTHDKVFLLSEQEVIQYLPIQSSRILYNRLNVGKSWMLRTPGADTTSMAVIWSDGSIFTLGLSITSFKRRVRPAIWVRLK